MKNDIIILDDILADTIRWLKKLKTIILSVIEDSKFSPYNKTQRNEKYFSIIYNFLSDECQ